MIKIAIVVVCILLFVWLRRTEKSPTWSEPRERALICPHCQTKGFVTTRRVQIKRGFSGAKATGALLTAGLSLLATGLSRRQSVTEASCSNCETVWHFE
jgi:hypothetical protein